MSLSVQVIVSAVDRLTGPLGKMDFKMENWERRVTAIGGKMVALGIATTGTLGAMATAAVRSASMFEDLGVQLETLYRSKSKALEMRDWIVQFAAKTPFEIQGITQAAAQLEAYGLDAKHWLPLAGDMAAGMARDITDAAAAVAKATVGESERLKEMGISSRVLKEFGAHASAAGGLAATSAEDVKALTTAIEKVAKTRFEGGMARFSETLTGKVSNLSDAFTNLKATVGETFLPTIKDVVDKVTEATSSWNEWAKSNDKFVRGVTYGLGSGGVVLTALGVLGMALPKIRDGWFAIRDASLLAMGAQAMAAEVPVAAAGVGAAAAGTRAAAAGVAAAPIGVALVGTAGLAAAMLGAMLDIKLILDDTRMWQQGKEAGAKGWAATKAQMQAAGIAPPGDSDAIFNFMAKRKIRTTMGELWQGGITGGVTAEELAIQRWWGEQPVSDRMARNTALSGRMRAGQGGYGGYSGPYRDANPYWAPPVPQEIPIQVSLDAKSTQEFLDGKTVKVINRIFRSAHSGRLVSGSN